MDREYIVDQYFNHYKSISSLADELNTYPNKIRRIILRAGKKLRSKSESQKITLEIPGGMIDEGENPEQAAKRELLEETGYESTDWQLIGITDPNPAIQNNKCYIFLAKNSKFIKTPNLDNTEEIEILNAPLKEIPKLIQDSYITHSLVITAFYYYNLLNLK